jgi:hypothetical protein
MAVSLGVGGGAQPQSSFKAAERPSRARLYVLDCGLSSKLKKAREYYD